jgi:DNA-binding transcriptional ArsR family regulator
MAIGLEIGFETIKCGFTACVLLDMHRIIHNNTVVDILGTLFLALSDPTRRAIIERLTQGSATVNELADPFAVSQQMVSKHIAYLIRANIVVKTKRGRESVCTLKPEAIKVVSDWALEYRRFWDESFDKLDAVLIELKKTEVSDD